MQTLSIEKLTTGIEGFDHIAHGGLPKGRTTLVVGTAGSAKTVFACQFLVEGIRQANEAGVFITFEESADDIRRNMNSFGWDITAWEREGKWAFVDASRRPDEEYMTGGAYDLGALLARVESKVRSLNATRVVVDSVGAIMAQFDNPNLIRYELFKMSAMLKQMGVTSLMTAERLEEGVSLTRFGVEEFVADNVVILRNRLEDERRRRTIEILKFRGTMHAKGEFPFTITDGKGVIVIPLSAFELTQQPSNTRITTGNSDLDAMCGGGLYQNSIALVSGASGTGKTLIATSFVAGGSLKQERSVFFAFEESREQLVRNAANWGMDLDQMEREGWLRIECIYPESAGLQDHLIRIQSIIDEYRPSRVVLDSLSALERIATPRSLSEFTIGLLAFFKREQITALCTTATASLFGGANITESQTSTITDAIIVLRYLESNSELRRGVIILKLRGSNHDKRIREFTMDHQGLHIGRAFRNISGILTGHVAYMTAGESELVRGMFEGDSDPMSTSSSGGD